MKAAAAPPADRKKGSGWPILIILLLACFQLPFSSFMADDFILLGILEKVSPITWAGPLNLYSLADGNPGHLQQAKESGALPWFFHPRFRLHFFRPLSSALLAADHALFGLHPIGYGIHSILWLIILVWGASRLLKKFMPGPTGFLATIIYAASGILATAAFWPACRHNLVAPALALWAFLAHLQWQEKGRRRFLALSLAGFALAFLAGEAAVGILAYPAAHAWLSPRQARRKRLTALIPLLLLTLLYLTFYSVIGYGAGLGSEYENPLSHPGNFLRVLPQRMATTAGILFFGPAADLLAFDPAGRPFLVMGGILAALLLAFMLRFCRSRLSIFEKQQLRWLIVGMILSSLPFAASMTISFHLVVPFIGWSAVIAVILRSRSLLMQKGPGWRRGLFRVGCALLFFFHLILSPLIRMSEPPFLKKMMSTRVESAMHNLDRDFPHLSRLHVIILSAPDLAIGFHTYFYRRLYRLPMPVSWQVLHWGREEPLIRRTSDNAFSMEFPGGGLKRAGLQPNDRILLAGMEIAITAAADSIINRISCTLDRSLNDPSLVFLTWREGRWAPVKFPAT